MASFFKAVDSCSLPDEELRQRVRAWIQSILQPFYALTGEAQQQRMVEFGHGLKKMPVAIMTEDTSEAMYEMPTEFYELLLGKRLKYSCLYYAKPSYTIDEAEDAMLQLYCDRAQIKDGQNVLDLGGGWGALTFFIAERCPSSHVTTVSYSKSQKEYVDNQCRKRGISNVEAIDADLTVLDLPQAYDRVLCIELLEHFKNYGLLLKKIASWMKPDGLLFIEDFTHKHLNLQLENKGDEGIESWLATYYFPGGTIPANTLLLYFQDDVSIVDHWTLNGKHFARTSEDGLKLLDEKIDLIVPIFNRVYGEDKAAVELARWRAFAIVFAEIFGFNNGEEWIVSHYLFNVKK